MPTDRQMDEDAGYTCSGTLPSHRWMKMQDTSAVGRYPVTEKKEMMPSATTRMQLETVLLRGVGQTDEHHMISLIRGI